MTNLPASLTFFIASMIPSALGSRTDKATPFTSGRPAASSRSLICPSGCPSLRFISAVTPNFEAPSFIPVSTAFHQSELLLVMNSTTGFDADPPAELAGMTIGVDRPMQPAQRIDPATIGTSPSRFRLVIRVTTPSPVWCPPDVAIGQRRPMPRRRIRSSIDDFFRSGMHDPRSS